MTPPRGPVPPRGTAPTDPAPVLPGQRIEVLDVLRGLAIFGIFVINLESFTLWDFLSAAERAQVPLATFDPTTSFLHRLFFLGKFYTLFSLLFGIGFAIQLSRARERRTDLAPLYFRRLAILLAFGLLHLYFWSGDILVLYAVLGFILVGFRGWSDRALLAAAALLIALPVAQKALIAATEGALDPGTPFLLLADRIDAWLGYVEGSDLVVVGRGGWEELLRWNAAGPFWRWSLILSEGREFKVLGVFLIGFVVGRGALLADLARRRRLLGLVLLIGAVIGLHANAALALLWEDQWERPVLTAAIYAAGVVPLGLAYAAGVCLLWLRPWGRRLLGVFAPVGRTALTNYLLQTAIGIGVFYGVGLGLAGTMGPTAWSGFAVAVFALQVVASALWLRAFRYGPMEWLWRRLTYGRPLPNRLRPEAVGPG